MIQGRVGHVPSVMSGRDAIIEGLVAKRLVMQPEQRRHIATNLVVLEQTDSVARAASYLVLIATLDGPPRTLATGRYEDDLVKCEDGQLAHSSEVGHTGLRRAVMPARALPRRPGGARAFSSRSSPRSTAIASGFRRRPRKRAASSWRWGSRRSSSAPPTAMAVLPLRAPRSRRPLRRRPRLGARARRAPPRPGDGRGRVRLHELGCAGGLLPRSRRQHRRADRASWDR